MAMNDADIVGVLHHRDPVVKDAIKDCASRNADHAEREQRARLEAMLHRLSDEMTEQARRARSNQTSAAS